MKRQRVLLGLILLGYLAITLAYGAVNPLFEAPDEHWHFFTAAAIAADGRLPVVEDPPDEFLGQEAAQPPLYYLLGAAILAPFDQTGWREAILENPYAWIGDASALANVNRMIHTAAEDRPWQGYALPAHLLRVFSTLLGLGTLLCIYAAGRLAWPTGRTRPLMATALVAFLPQFNFLHASITNDTLIIFLCSLGLVQLIWFWRNLPDLAGGSAESPLAGEPSLRPARISLRLVALGLTIGLAALSKNAGVLLLLYSLGFLAVLGLRDRNYRFITRAAALVAVPAVLVAGWLWWRNQMLYGDWTATAPFIAIAGGDRGYSLGQVLAESDGLLTSFVAVFGWFNLRPPDWVYWVWAAIVVLAVAGALVCMVKAYRRRTAAAQRPPTAAQRPTTNGSNSRSSLVLALLLALWPLLVYAGLVLFMMRTEAAQGRLLFPAILPIALGLSWGLAGWGRCAPRLLGSINRRLAPLVALLALATSVYSLAFVIQPTYQRPPVAGALPPGAIPVLPELVDRGEGISLLGAEVETEMARPGDAIWLTLYWRADDPPAEPPEFVLEVFGRRLQRIANLHSYHGRGLFPANLWPAGQIIADRFAVRVDPRAEAPVLARIFARIDGGQPGIEVGSVRVAPLDPLPAPDNWPAELGNNIALVDATMIPSQVLPGQNMQVVVTWYVPRGVPARDYTTLLHLGQPDSPPLSTGDSPPLDGDLPTSTRANGETIDDRYFLSVPVDLSPGRYPVWIGMYDPATGVRLPVTVAGEVQPNGVYLAGWVEVSGE